MSRAGKEQHQIALELVEMIAPQSDRFHQGGPVRVESYEVQSSEGGGVFVLFSHRFAENIACDVEGSFRQRVFGEWEIKIGGQSL